MEDMLVFMILEDWEVLLIRKIVHFLITFFKLVFKYNKKKDCIKIKNVLLS